jgi:hypothetical protein
MSCHSDARAKRTRRNLLFAGTTTTEVPHPFAFFAKGWENEP